MQQIPFHSFIGARLASMRWQKLFIEFINYLHALALPLAYAVMNMVFLIISLRVGCGENCLIVMMNVS